MIRTVASASRARVAAHFSDCLGDRECAQYAQFGGRGAGRSAGSSADRRYC